MGAAAAKVQPLHLPSIAEFGDEYGNPDLSTGRVVIVQSATNATSTGVTSESGPV